MIGFILIFLCFIELLQCFLLYTLIQTDKEAPSSQTKKMPPKARNSFVVKRMEEKLKEALYGEE